MKETKIKFIINRIILILLFLSITYYSFTLHGKIAIYTSLIVFLAMIFLYKITKKKLPTTIIEE